MASKTYVSEQPSLFMGKGVDFSHGKFTTDDVAVQKLIEGNERFGKSIKLMPSPLEAAKAHAVSLRALAVKAPTRPRASRQSKIRRSARCGSCKRRA